MHALVIKVIPQWLRWKSNSSAVYYSLQVCMPARISPNLCVIYQLAKDLLEVSVQNFDILSLWLPSFLSCPGTHLPLENGNNNLRFLIQ